MSTGLAPSLTRSLRHGIPSSSLAAPVRQASKVNLSRTRNLKTHIPQCVAIRASDLEIETSQTWVFYSIDPANDWYSLRTTLSREHIGYTSVTTCTPGAEAYDIHFYNLYGVQECFGVQHGRYARILAAIHRGQIDLRRTLTLRLQQEREPCTLRADRHLNICRLVSGSGNPYVKEILAMEGKHVILYDLDSPFATLAHFVPRDNTAHDYYPDFAVLRGHPGTTHKPLALLQFDSPEQYQQLVGNV